jgi:hypothetical protein
MTTQPRRPRRPKPTARPGQDVKSTATHTALYIRGVPRDVADLLSAQATALGVHVADVLAHLVYTGLRPPRRRRPARR